MVEGGTIVVAGAAVPPRPVRPKPLRDPRLDVFRGAGMLIILVAHIPGNGWEDWIPARFGFSDATEIFVFCSGVASSLAFGRVFDQRGWLLGAARVGHRAWQVYWAHVGVFVATVALLALADRARPGAEYLASGLNLGGFLADPGGKLLGLLTLSYVPNYFDVLPMYIVILTLLPVMMAAARLGPAAPLALSLALWGAAGMRWLDLPADGDTGRTWFFNPFAWQALFFAGFGLQRGWLPLPAPSRGLLLAALAVVALAAPVSCQEGFGCHALWGAVPAAGEVLPTLGAYVDKTHLGPLRMLHFLALAYLAHTLAGPGGARLRRPWAGVLALVGRQSLAVFMSGMVLAQGLGVLLDLTGRDPLAISAANLAGCAALILVARTAAWFKAAPWGARAGSTERDR